MTQRALFDPGLQPERTALAWRRSVLSLAIGAAVALRILPPLLGPVGIGAGLIGLISAGIIWILASRRERAVQKTLLTASGPLPGAGLLIVLVIMVTVGAALALTIVVIT